MSHKIASPGLIAALIITFNEEANISRTLDSLSWLSTILIVDSGSTDSTISIASKYPSVEIAKRPFDTFASQCNWGLSLLSTDWVLSIDADYVISAELSQEILKVITTSDDEIVGFSIPFRYCVWGRPLRGALLPPRTSLYRTSAGVYRNEGHGHRLELPGIVSRLSSPIFHDDRKPLDRWLRSQHRYMLEEANNLLQTSSSKLSFADRLRKHSYLAPFVVFFLCLFWKGGLLDGRRGWSYALQRMYAEILLLLLLIDRKFHDGQKPHSTTTLKDNL